MFKKCLFFLIPLCLVNSALALTSAQQQNISAKMSSLCRPHSEKVGAAFIDLKTGWQFSVNGTQEFPAASVAKVAVMAAAYHLSDIGELNLDQKAMFKESDRLEGSGVLRWLKAGRFYTLRNLIRMMIVLSDNTATKIVADTVGLVKINEYIRGAGLSGTVVLDPTMLLERPSPDINQSTPLDIANLFVAIESRRGFSKASVREMLSYLKNQRYRWGIWRGVGRGAVVANKTGNLDGILNDAGIVYTKAGNYALSIFTKDFKKQRDARQAINDLSRAVFEEYTGTRLISPKKRFFRKAKKRYRRFRRR